MVNEFSATFKDGKLTGVQVRGVDGVARGLKAGDLGAQLATVNEAALLRVAELEAQVKATSAELTAYKSRGLQAAQAVLDAPDKEACDAIARDIRVNERDRQKSAALVKLAEAQAEADKFG